MVGCIAHDYNLTQQYARRWRQSKSPAPPQISMIVPPAIAKPPLPKRSMPEAEYETYMANQLSTSQDIPSEISARETIGRFGLMCP